MTDATIVGLALVLGVLIAGVELLRPRPRGAVDFLRATSGLFFMCFVVVPLFLRLDDLTEFRGSVWSWVLKNRFDHPAFAMAEAVAILGYGAIVLGFHLGRGWRTATLPAPPADPARVPPGWRSQDLLPVAALLGAGGIACLTIYTRSIGGLSPLILQASAFRGTDPPVVTPFAFLKTLSPMVMSAAFLFHALRVRRQLAGLPSRYGLAFTACLVASLLVLFHQAGRFPLAAFLLTFPLARVIRLDRVPLRYAVGLPVLVLLFVLFGKQAFEATMTSSNLTDRLAEVGRDAAAATRMILVEFAFPVVGLANALIEIPGDVGYRWFADVPLAVQYLIPQRLLGVTHPPTVSMVNTLRFGSIGTIPADLLTFGYYSLGVVGVLVTTVLFGWLLAVLDRRLQPSGDPVDCTLRAAWIFFVSLRVMYGDPQLIWSGGLHLVVLALLLYSVRLLAEPRLAPPRGAAA